MQNPFRLAGTPKPGSSLRRNAPANKGALRETIAGWSGGLEDMIRNTTAQLRAEKDKKEAIFQSMAEGVIVLDGLSRVTDLNQAAERLLGTPRSVLFGHQILMGQTNIRGSGQVVTRNLEMICGPKFEDQYLKCWEFFNCSKSHCPAYESEELRCWLIANTQCFHPEGAGAEPERKLESCSKCVLFVKIREKYNPPRQTVSAEIRLENPKRVLRVLKTPMFDVKDVFMGNVLVLRDITRDKELEEMKSEFISTVSHDLRTPLSSIKSFTEILLEDMETIDAETQRRFLGIISAETDRLTRLISSLLDLQKMTSQKMKWDLERLQLRDVVESCIRAFSGLAKKNDMDLDFSCAASLPFIYGDRDKLSRVLSNLLSNALKFGNKGGSIRVKMEENADGVLVTVADEGIGIPAEEQEKIFERFYQAESPAASKKMGTGLGLAICREIVRHHQGKIWVESRPGEGSRFFVFLPAIGGDRGLTFSESNPYRGEENGEKDPDL